jgi:aspartate-semialdehyde dehydrogenase
MKPISVAVLGATGTVGQKFVALLEGHPQFEIAEAVASPRSAGKAYADACAWKQDQPIPDRIARMTVKSTADPLTSPILFSGLDSSVAGEAEELYAKAGHVVISNSRNHRMDPDVPLVIPRSTRITSLWSNARRGREQSSPTPTVRPCFSRWLLLRSTGNGASTGCR